jgi:hypothetical protein
LDYWIAGLLANARWPIKDDQNPVCGLAVAAMRSEFNAKAQSRQAAKLLPLNPRTAAR